MNNAKVPAGLGIAADLLGAERSTFGVNLDTPIVMLAGVVSAIENEDEKEEDLTLRNWLLENDSKLVRFEVNVVETRAEEE